MGSMGTRMFGLPEDQPKRYTNQVSQTQMMPEKQIRFTRALMRLMFSRQMTVNANTTAGCHSQTPVVQTSMTALARK